jgi:fructose-bisphosphate aldolase class II
MPLVSIRETLKRAQAEGFGVPLFDVFEMHSAVGVVQALEAKRAPGIVAFPSPWVENPLAAANAAAVRQLAADASVPVSLMLDHGASFEACIKALELGFTDIMYDGSSLPVEQNIANSKLIVRAAHALGVPVEAEVGHVGMGSDYESVESARGSFTDPAVAKRFVEETGVDYLAVAFGSAHGLYKGTPSLALDLLAEIRGQVDVPLVMHGGTGLSTEQFQGAIAHGIAKINIGTDLVMTATERLIAAGKGERAVFFGMTAAITAAYRERCEVYLDIFGTTGKA